MQPVIASLPDTGGEAIAYDREREAVLADIQAMADAVVTTARSFEDEIVALSDTILRLIWKHPRPVILSTLATVMVSIAEAHATEFVSPELVLLTTDELMQRMMRNDD